MSNTSDRFDRIRHKFGKFFGWFKRHKVLTALLVLVLLISISVIDTRVTKANEPAEVKYEDFMKDLKAHNIDTIYYSSAEEYMRYTLLNDETRDMTKKQREDYKYDKDDWRMTLYPSGETFREDMLKYNVNLEVRSFEPKVRSAIALIISVVFPILLLLLLAKALLFGGNKKYETIAEGSIKETFDDVVGLDEIKKDLQFIVALLQDSRKLKKFNMKVPKGILFSGEPGTGKTLLARALAGECDVPYVHLRGSDCIELLAGSGAKKIREVFRTAKKCAPCIVFIDEIDAIGMNRNAHSSNEDVQTLTALLQEMDGFETHEGIFVIGATNKAQNLDSALLRAGRFDRQVIVPLPKDWVERKKIFEHYLKDVEYDADLDSISKECVGFSGADIDAVVNESKIIASMADADKITLEHIEEAIDKKVFKGNRDGKSKQDKERVLVAYHEAGHAVLTYLYGKPMIRASIIASTSGVGGYVKNADEDKKLFTKTDLENQVKICYAGACSERIKFGDVTTGASSDIEQATNIMQYYITRVGFNKEFGMVSINALANSGILIDSKYILQLCSEMAVKYEKEVEDTLRKNYYLVECLAEELLKRETMSSDAILEVLNESKLKRGELVC